MVKMELQGGRNLEKAMGNPSGAAAGFSIPNVPPPPPEVKIRTLRSDLESMAQSGGSSPQFRSVAVPGVSAASEAAGEKKTKDILTAVLAVIAVGLVAAVGFLVYQLFFRK